MKLSELLQNGEISGWEKFSDREIVGVTSSSAVVTEGEVFVAITGLHTDGHRFIGDAVARGASAVVVEADALNLTLLVNSAGILTAANMFLSLMMLLQTLMTL